MENRKFILVANDKSPSDALGKLGDALQAQGDEVIRFLGGGKLEVSRADMFDAIELGAGEGAVVLVGMSSKPELSEYELFALEVADYKGATYGMYSDTFYAYRRAWFSQYRYDCSHLFIASAGELVDAQGFFPTAKVTVVGNPSWEGIVEKKLSDETIREAVGLMPILVPGNKTHHTNVDLVRTALMSIPEELKQCGVTVVFAPHPGELKQDPAAMDRYRQEIVEGMSVEDTRGLRFLPQGIRSQDVLRVAVATISACSPTTDIQAVFLRVPAFNYLGHPDTRARLMKEFGRETPELCSLGVVMSARSPREIKSVIGSEGIMNALRDEQSAKFPELPEVGDSVRKMVQALYS